MQNLVFGQIVRLIPFGLLRLALPDKFILHGHLISNNPHPASKLYLYQSCDEFDKAVIELKSLGYRFVDVSEYMKNDKKKKILLTFDDGFKVIKDDTHGYLKRHNIPYLIFIIAEALENDSYNLNQDPTHNNFIDVTGAFLNEADVLELKADGVHIGYHGRNHLRLGLKNRKKEDSLKQLTIPERYRHLFSVPLCFAYPFSAPKDYLRYNKYLTEKVGVEFIMDTKGFYEPVGNHFFRASMETENRSFNGDKFRYVLKKQILVSIINKIKQRFVLRSSR